MGALSRSLSKSAQAHFKQAGDGGMAEVREAVAGQRNAEPTKPVKRKGSVNSVREKSDRSGTRGPIAGIGRSSSDRNRNGRESR